VGVDFFRNGGSPTRFFPGGGIFLDWGVFSKVGGVEEWGVDDFSRVPLGGVGGGWVGGPETLLGGGWGGVGGGVGEGVPTL
jgi:hypothetical protein